MNDERSVCGTVLVIAACLVLGAACRRTAHENGKLLSEPEARQVDIAAIRRMLGAIVSADNARDLNAVMALYANDAVLLPPDEKAVAGKESIRPRYQSLFDEFKPEISISHDEIITDGDWAFARGMTTGKMTPRNGGTAGTVNDKYLMILRRQPDGTWRIARLMWSKAG